MKATLTVEIDFDPNVTDAESIASAADRLMETALSTPEIMEEYGDPRFGEFFVAPQSQPTVIVEVAGGVLQEAYADCSVRLVLLDWDAEDCEPSPENNIFQAGDERAYVVEMPVTPIDKIVGTQTETALKAAGIEMLTGSDNSMQESRRWVLYDMNCDCLLRTRVYSDYDEAVEDAEQANDILVLPLAIQDCIAYPQPRRKDA